jgi:hypothetical protein
MEEEMSQGKLVRNIKFAAKLVRAIFSTSISGFDWASVAPAMGVASRNPNEWRRSKRLPIA